MTTESLRAAHKPLQIDDDDGYVANGVEVCVTLPPADVLALQTLSGAWTHAMSFLRVQYGRCNADQRDSIDGWIDEFRSAVQRLAGLSDRISAALAQPSTEPVAWVDSLENPQPRCVTDLKYCSAAEWDRGEHLKYVPVYAAPPRTKPVAPLVQHAKDDFPFCYWAQSVHGRVYAEIPGGMGLKWFPLYTAPHSTERKPLTEEEIKLAFHAARNAKLGASQDNSAHRLSVVEIARAIERAHGIGGST